VRFVLLDSFARDYRRLKTEHQAVFAGVVRAKFAPACDKWAIAQSQRLHFIWPKSLRVDELTAGGGVMEMSWSFASPDGRATFQLDRVDSEWVCVWRRIGDHDVFRSP
jgi:hypothetical protein